MFNSAFFCQKNGMDYFLFSLLGFYAMRGWRKGGYFVLFSLAESVLCFCIAFLLNEHLFNLLSKIGIESFFEKLISNLTDKTNFSAYIGGKDGQIASKLAHISTFLMIYFLAKIVVGCIKKVFKFSKTSCPSVGNGILGAMVGIFKGCFVFFVAYCALNVATVFSSSEKLAGFVANAKLSNGLLSVFEEKIISVFLFH